MSKLSQPTKHLAILTLFPAPSMARADVADRADPRAARARAVVEVALEEEAGVASTTKAVMVAEAKVEEEAEVVAMEAKVRRMGERCIFLTSVLRDMLIVTHTMDIAYVLHVLWRT